MDGPNVTNVRREMLNVQEMAIIFIVLSVGYLQQELMCFSSQQVVWQTDYMLLKTPPIPSITTTNVLTNKYVHKDGEPN